MEIFGFSDSDFANDDSDSVSVSGYAFRLNPQSALISWRSGKQDQPGSSTTEAEYMALYEASCEAVFLRELFGEITKGPKKSVNITYKEREDPPDETDLPPANIRADNKGAISLAHHPSFHRKTKHIKAKYHTTRYNIDNYYITVKYVPSAHNVADIMTKPLNSSKLKSFSCIRGTITMDQINTNK